MDEIAELVTMVNSFSHKTALVPNHRRVAIFKNPPTESQGITDQ